MYLINHFFFGGGGGGVVLAAGGGGGVLPFEAAGGGGGGVFPFAGGGGGTFDPVVVAAGFGGVCAFGASFPAGEVALGAYFLASLGASFFCSAGLAPVAAGFLSPAFLSPALVSAGFLASVVAVCAACSFSSVSFPFLCLPESRTVSSGSISVTTPAATVFPPSLNANLTPLVIVNGKWSLALTLRLSPGLAILTFSGKKISAAVSAVL